MKQPLPPLPPLPHSRSRDVGGCCASSSSSSFSFFVSCLSSFWMLGVTSDEAVHGTAARAPLVSAHCYSRATLLFSEAIGVDTHTDTPRHSETSSFFPFSFRPPYVHSAAQHSHALSFFHSLLLSPDSATRRLSSKECSDRAALVFAVGKMGNLCCCAKSTTVRPQSSPTPQSPPKPSEVSEEEIGFVDSLPSGAEEVTVDHVYDGDTMTVRRRNGQTARVRFLGVDAPELKEKEPYAQESADYVKQLCPKNSRVWLCFESGSQTDKYGRLLAYVYVPSPKGGPGFHCLNICVLQAGLASFYAVKDGELRLRPTLLSAQRRAMEKRRNLWRDTRLDKAVYVTRNGNAFHENSCEHVSTAKLSTVTVAAALDRGLSPCRTCHPV